MHSARPAAAGRVVFQRALSPEYRHLGVAAPGFPGTFQPGQFVMLRSPRTVDPLIGRAFSIYRLTGGAEATLEILYKIMGKGTAALAAMQAGDAIEILGPLGNGFDVSAGERTTVLVAGGIGVPPIAALADMLRRAPVERRAENRDRTSDVGPRTEVHVFLGGKTSADILCVKDFEAAGAVLTITTEDGSVGAAGMITQPLARFLDSAPGPVGVYACGPAGMLAAVARLTEALRIPCQVSVEASMACGFGACMGCAIELRNNGPGPKYKLVCQDGPVFDARTLAWGAS